MNSRAASPDEVTIADITDHHFEPAFVGGITGNVRLPTIPMGSAMEIAKGARRQIIQDADGGSPIEQSLDEVRANESGTARDQDRAHVSVSETDDGRVGVGEVLHRVASVHDQGSAAGDLCIVETRVTG